MVHKVLNLPWSSLQQELTKTRCIFLVKLHECTSNSEMSCFQAHFGCHLNIKILYIIYDVKKLIMKRLLIHICAFKVYLNSNSNTQKNWVMFINFWIIFFSKIDAQLNNTSGWVWIIKKNIDINYFDLPSLSKASAIHNIKRNIFV